MTTKRNICVEGRNLSRHFVGQVEPLFQNIDIVLTTKIQFLVGRNGVGKSVLSSILAGIKKPDSGEIIHYSSVGYLDQGLQAFEGSVAERLGVAAVLAANERILAGTGTPIDFDLMQDQWDLPARIEQIFEEFEFKLCMLYDLWPTLSGGQRTRMLLLQLCLNDYEFMILDEPTNHLDFESRKWFAKWMRRQKGLLILSHDRDLMSDADIILEMTSRGVTGYRGDYDAYFETQQAKLKGLDQAIMTAKKQLAKDQTSDRIAKERAQSRASSGAKRSVRKGESKLESHAHKENAEKTISRDSTANYAKLNKSRNELLRVQKEKEQIEKLHFSVSEPAPLHGPALYLEGLVLPRGDKKPIHMTLSARQKMALLGRNGSGKSTLLKVLSGNTRKSSGIFKIANDFAFLDQHFSLLDEKTSALGNFMHLAPGWLENEYRTALAQLRLFNDRIFLPVSNLSGGERVKVALASLCLGPISPSLMLLDEPDNHLDIESKEVLEHALRHYAGSLFVVSHDSTFLKNIGITNSYCIGENRITDYIEKDINIE